MKKNILPINIKRTFAVLFISLMAIFTTVYASGNYVSVQASVMVYSKPISGIFEITSLNDTPYEPLEKRITANENGNKFTVSIDEPGDYTYQINQAEMTDNTVIYDKTVYDVLFHAENDGNGGLAITTVITEHDTEKKVTKIVYENKSVPTPTSTPDEKEDGCPPTGCEECPPEGCDGYNPPQIIKTVLTADSFNSGLYFLLLMISITAGIYSYVRIKQAEKEGKENDSEDM